MSSRWFAWVCYIVFSSAVAWAQAPAITTPPRSRTAVAGQPVTFNVVATGAAPLTYRWLRNGVAVPGATTATLTLANAASADRGWYHVEVTNASGTVRAVVQLDVMEDRNALWAWGDNYNSQSTPPTRLGPVVAVAAGWATWALRPNGELVAGSGNQLQVAATDVVSISTNTGHVLALRSDGTVVAIGDNNSGQTQVPAGLVDAVGVAAGSGFSLALRANGTVVGWGASDNNRSIPPANAVDVVAIAAGGTHALALRRDRTVIAWGANDLGQATVPAGLTDVVAIDAGGTHSLALRADGTVVAWGSNANGQSTVPAGLTGVARISAGGSHNLALKTDGSVVAWGTSTSGAGVVPGYYSGSSVRGISAGFNHSVLIVPAVAPAILAQPASQSMAAGESSQLSVAVSGTRPLAYQWKKNGVPIVNQYYRVYGMESPNLAFGPVEAGDAASYTVEISNAAGSVVSNAAVLTVRAAPVFSVRPLSRRVAVGTSATFTATATGAGSVTYQWRRNGQTIAGATDASFTIASVTHAHRGAYEVVATDAVGATARSVFYVYPSTLPAARGEVRRWGDGYWTAPVLADPIALSVGERMALALRADGYAQRWGEYSELPSVHPVAAVAAADSQGFLLRADGGVVGTGAFSLPIGLRDVVAVAAGDTYGVAVRADGTLIESGSSITLPIPDMASVANVVAVAAGVGGVLAVRADGTVAPLRNALLRPPPAGLGNVTAAAVGQQHYLALRADGTVVGWGTGAAATVPSGLTDVVEIAAGLNHSIARKADGSVVVWGSNALGQLDVPSDLGHVLALAGAPRHTQVIRMATAPEFLVPPESRTIVVGSTTGFAVSVLGAAPITYQWSKGGVPLANGGRISGAQSSGLTITDAQAADAGSYTVTVTDASGTVVSSAVTLNVLPQNAIPPNDAFAAAQVLAGASGVATGHNFGATGETGEPALGPASSSVWYSWTAPSNGRLHLRTQGSDFLTVLAVYTGGAVNTLTQLLNVSAPNLAFGAQITMPVRAGTTYRLAVASATALRGGIQLTWDFGAAPSNDDFGSASLLSGVTGSITGNNTCATPEPNEPSLSGSLSSLWYSWTAPTTGRAVFRISQHAFSDVLRVFTGTSVGSLNMLGESYGVPPTNGASVALNVTAGTTYRISVGGMYADRGSFTLSWEAQTLPLIVTEPANQNAALGGSATFTVAATGGGLTYQWYFNGTIVPNATTVTLTLSNLQRSQIGEYQVIVTNTVGATSSRRATLGGMNPVPTITTQPANRLVTVGQPATFAVSATGAGPLLYQWRRNGVEITGANTTTYTIAATERFDADIYDVAVYDGLSLTTSSRARLDVAPEAYPGLQRFQPAGLQPERNLAGAVHVLVPAPGGKFFIGGAFDTVDARPRSRIARFNADGTLDAGFVPPVISGGVVRVVLPLADGGAFVAGDFQSVDGSPRSVVIKLRPSGALDLSFTHSGASGTVYSLALDGQGRLLMAGTVGRSLNRLLPSGQLDESFNSGQVNSVNHVTVLPDGRLLIAGWFAIIGSQENPVYRRGLARLNSDGTPDPTFDANSWLASGGATCVSFLPDGSFFAGGAFTLVGGGTRLAVRVGANGALDSSFSADPTLTGTLIGLAPQPSGKLVITGSDGVVRRLLPGGALDPEFPTRSAVSVTYSAAVEADGRVLLGSARNAPNAQPTLARLSVDGAPDESVTAVPRLAGYVHTLAAAAGDKTIVAGRFDFLGGVLVPSLGRLNADGTVDATFQPVPGPSLPQIVIPLPGGGSYVYYNGVLRRLNPDGSRDTTFADLSEVSFANRNRAVVMPEGRLLVAATNWRGLRSRLVLMNPDGSTNDFFSSGIDAGSWITALAAQPDGKVIVGGGFTIYNNTPRNRLVRILPDGALDPSFNPGAGPDGVVEAIRVLPDGRMLVAGSFATYDNFAAPYLVRLNSDGTRDPSFGAAPPHPVGAIIPQEDGRVIAVAKSGPEIAGTNHVIRLNADGTRDGSWLVRGQTRVLPALQLSDRGRLQGASFSEAFYADTAITFGLVDFAPASSPVILTPPQTVATTAGSIATFSVVVSGTAPFSYQWNFEGVPIASATDERLVIPNVQLAHSGNYSVTVTNEFGAVTSVSAPLRGANPLPIIGTQPGSVSVLAGQNVTLGVQATATGALSYQWRRNGVPIAGATAATLDLGAAGLQQDGAVYDVLVSDGLSLTISARATVNVRPSSYPEVVTADASFAPTFDTARGTMAKFVRAPDGRVYVAGRFSRIAGVPAWNLARLTAAGAIDATFRAASADGIIYTIEVQPDGKILIGGAFTRVGGELRPGVARLHAGGALDLSFEPVANLSGTRALKVQADGRVVVGGSFSLGGGLVRLNNDGTLDGRFTNYYLNGTVFDLAVQPDGRIIAGGSFTGPSGYFNFLARLEADGYLDVSFNPTGFGPTGTVRVLRQMGDGRLLVGGYFSSYMGASTGRIMRLNASGTLDATWNAGAGFSALFGAGVEALDVQPDGRILAAGGFTAFNGVSRPQVARLTADGALDAGWTPPASVSGTTAIAALANGSTLVGGEFAGNLTVLSSAGAEAANTLANSVFSAAYVQVAPLVGGKTFAIGDFTHVNGVARPRVARLNVDGTLDATFSAAGTGPSIPPRSMRVQADGRVVLLGDFDSYNGTARQRFARVNLDGSLDPAFAPAVLGYSPDSSSRLWPLLGDRLMYYSFVGSAGYFVRLNPDGTRDAVFRAPEIQSGYAPFVSVAEQPDGRILLSGQFTFLEGAAVGPIIRLLPDGRLDSSFNVAADGAVRAILPLSDGRIIIGGDFLTVNTQAAPRLARLNANGTRDGTFNVGFGADGSVRRFIAQADGKLIVGGAFTAINGTAHTRYVARLQADGAVDRTFAAIGFNGSPDSLAMLDDGGLLLAGGNSATTSSVQQYGVHRGVSVPGPVVLAQPENTAVLAGNPVALVAASAGGAAPVQQWLKNGVPVAGATGSTLLIPNAQPADSGSYVLRVMAGSAVVNSTPAVVTVSGSAPVFETAPGAISGFGGAIALGSNWPLVAPSLAAASAPVSYQWFRNGSEIAGATQRNFAPVWQAGDSGIYHVRVANAFGQLTSATFSQTVTGTPDWRWQHPSPQGNPLGAVAYLNSRVLAGGARGTIVLSQPNSTWSVSRLGASESVFAFAFGSGAYVALSSFGGIWHSSTGETWLRRNSGVGSDGRYLRAVTYGAGRFVAVGDGGVAVTSSDGLSWSPAALGSSDTFGAIAYGAGRFVAVGARGRTVTSTDGITWQAGATLPQMVTGVAFGGGRFVVAGGGPSGFVSTDGTSWAERLISNYSAAQVRGIQYGGGRFTVLVDNRFSSSTDGSTWTERSFSYQEGGAAVVAGLTYADNRYVLVNGGGDPLFTSPTGDSWSRSALGSSFDYVFLGAAGGTNEMIAVGDGRYAGGVWSMTDGGTWSVSDTGAFNAVYDVASSGTRFVTVGLGGQIRTKLESGPWSGATSGTNQHLLGVNYVNGRFFAAGTGGTLLTSLDGTSWSSVLSGSTSTLYKVAYGNNTYVAVGAAGTVFSSPAVFSGWTARTANGVTSDIPGVAFGAGKFVLVSESGSIRTSTDGNIWIAQTNPLGFGLSSVIFAGGKFFAFITGNTDYLVSSDGVTWTAAQHGSANTNIAATVFAGRLHLLGSNLSHVSLPLNISAPVITAPPVSVGADENGTVTLSATATSGSGSLRYQWFKDGFAIVGATQSTLTLANLRLADAGCYTVLVSNEVDSVMSPGATVSVTPVVTRGVTGAVSQALSGPSALQGSFTIEGLAPKRVLIRAVGPTLATVGVTDFVVDPSATIVHAATGAVVASNEDWENADNVSQVITATSQIGAYPLLAGSKDAAILTTLNPGTYRVLLGAPGDAGRASLEIYEADTVTRLVYVGTRATITAARPLTHGVTLLAPPAGRSYLLRVLGPSLGSSTAVADPRLAVFSGATQLASNDDWAGDSTVATLAANVGAMAIPASSKDAALAFAPPAAGSYTIQVSSGDGSSGVALFELFEADAYRSATFPVAIVSPPENVQVTAGQAAKFGVVTIGRPGVIYQWSKGTTPLPGMTSPSFTIARAQLGDAGSYTVLAANGTSSATATATLAVQATNNATQFVHGRGYVPGGTVTVSNTLHYTGTPASLSWSVPIPANWRLASDTATSADVRPAIEATGTLAWTWNTPPPSPVTFTYTLSVPASETAPQSLLATATVGGTSFTASPNPLPVLRAPANHSADTSADGRISLVELTRVIELFNTRNGTTRTGCYVVAPSESEDGFAPDPTRGAVNAALADYHSGDTDRNGRVSLLELTRVIELFNYRNGTTRTGQYHVQAGTEDGFAPGP